MNTRLSAVLLSSLAIFLCSSANAQTTEPETVTLLPADDAIVQDGFVFPFDGFADVVEDGNHIAIQLISSEAGGFLILDSRSVLEFDLSSLAGRNVRQAFLKLRLTSYCPLDGSFVIPVEVRQYKGNGIVGLTDFHRGSFVTAFDMRSFTLSNLTGRVDITKAVRNALSHQWPYLGFTMRTNVNHACISFGSLEFPPSSSLVITLE